MSELEERIEDAFDSAVGALLLAGRSLRTIRDQRMYREEHGSFEKYVRDRWDMQRRRAYQYIDAADIIEDLSGSFDQKELPKSESALRPLASLTRIQRIAVWKAALDQTKRPGRGAVEQAKKDILA